MTEKAVVPGRDLSSLGQRAARGAFVTVGGQVLRIALQVASVVILARLLAPNDYGLIAMVTAVVGVADIFRDFGLSSAAVQAKTLSSAQRDNLFWINSGLGVVLFILIYLSAPAVAAFYHRTELVGITQALALMFVLNGVATQYRAGLNRDFRFTALAAADVISTLVSLVIAVAIALSGGTYWALVSQQLTQVGVMLLIVVGAARWAPRRPNRHAEMGSLLRFGWNFVGSQLIGYVGNNVDSVIIGARFGAGPLGLYNRGFQLLMRPLSQLRAPSTTVALPVLAKLQDTQDRYGQFIVRGQLALGYTLVAGLGFVAGAAEPICNVFLGSEWHGVIPILRLLAIAGAFQTLAFVGFWVYLSRDLTKDLRSYTLVSTGIRVTCIVVGSHWGVTGVAAGYAVGPGLAWPLSLWWLSKRTTIPVRELVLGAVRIIVVSAVVGGATFAVCALGASWLAGTALICSIGAAAAVFALLGVFVSQFRADMMAVFDIARRAVAR